MVGPRSGAVFIPPHAGRGHVRTSRRRVASCAELAACAADRVAPLKSAEKTRHSWNVAFSQVWHTVRRRPFLARRKYRRWQTLCCTWNAWNKREKPRTEKRWSRCEGNAKEKCNCEACETKKQPPRLETTHCKTENQTSLRTEKSGVKINEKWRAFPQGGC